MPELPPLMRDQRKIDADHLRLLHVFHFVLAGFAVIGIGFLLLHYTFIQVLIGNPELWKSQRGGSPPSAQILPILKWFYLFVGMVILTGGIGNLISGLFIRGRRCRTFSLIMAGYNCIQFPFGTLLGVFTFVILLRDSVKEIYDANL